MKEHKKLYKAGKNWIIATLAVATMGIIATQQNVSADVTAPSDVATSTTNSADPVKDAQNRVKAAQANQTQAQNTYNNQKQAVESAQQEFNNAQKKADEANSNLTAAQQNAKEATPENISKAKAAVEQQSEEVNTTKVANDQAQKKLSEYQQTQKKENTSVTNKTEEQNKIVLPNGYVDAYNNLIQDVDNYDQKRVKLDQLSSQVVALNSYKHNEVDKNIKINDIHHLDYEAQKDLSVWYANLLNQLINSYDFRDSKGNLLRNEIHFYTNNYALEALNSVEKALTDSRAIIETALYKSDDSSVEDGAGSDNLLVDNNWQNKENLLGKAAGVVSHLLPIGFTHLSYQQITNPSNITNLDELKEALFNNVLLFNLADRKPNAGELLQKAEDKLGDQMPDTAAYNKTFTKEQQLAIVNDMTYSFPTSILPDGNDSGVKEIPIAVDINRANQVVPHMVFLVQGHTKDSDAQSLLASDVSSSVVNPHAANDDLAQLQADADAKQEAYNQALSKLNELKQRLSSLEKATANLAKAQDAAQQANNTLKITKDKLSQEQAKLAQCQQQLDAANKALQVAKSNLANVITQLKQQKKEQQEQVNKALDAVTRAQKQSQADQAAYIKQQQVVTEKQATLDKLQGIKPWNENLTQQLANFINQYGKEHKMVFVQYNGKDKLNYGNTYPNFSKFRVNSDENSQETIGMSLDGSNKYDYNVVAIFSHDARNEQKFGEFHDTYLFTIHNGKPVVLVDQTTNGEYYVPCDAAHASSNVVDKLASFQGQFNNLAATVRTNTAEVQKAKDELAAAKDKLNELATAKDNSAKTLSSAQADLKDKEQALQKTKDELAEIKDSSTPANRPTNNTDVTFSKEQGSPEKDNNVNNQEALINSSTESQLKTSDKASHSNSVVRQLGTPHSDGEQLGNETKTTTARNNQQLPQTGNHNSIAVVALGVLASMFGLSLAMTRKEK